MPRSPAVDLEIQKNGHDEPITLSTGVRARFKPVPSMLIDELRLQIKDPPVPTQMVEGRDHPVENPLDPDYVAARLEANRQRGAGAIEVMALFGVELVDGVPPDEEWLPQLRFLEKRGRLDLSGYDLEDTLERQFVYKKYVALANDDWTILGRMMGIQTEDVEQAQANFRS